MTQHKFFPSEIIKKKRNGLALSTAEIQFTIESFVRGELPDYQMSALLMAIFLKGMNESETLDLTEAMLKSGRVLNFSHLGSPAIDKHSTGGLGDKTTMILAPIVAAAGVPVPMIAGRGLGHTGGTLDKLESIPGFSVQLSLDQFVQNVTQHGICIIGQTGEICPADKRIYALRDVTATIESLPLICASIMSKKLAEGAAGIVLDVKYGSGAFMKNAEEAEELATHLLRIAVGHGKKAVSLISSVQEPLGVFVGNALEIGECVAILKQESFMQHPLKAFADTQELSLRLAAEMIWLGEKATSAEEGYTIAKKLLMSGEGFKKFAEICKRQGGDLTLLPVAKEQKQVLAPKDGFIASFECEQLGLASTALGGGRLRAGDAIDPTAGIEFHAKLGSPVQKGSLLCTLHSSGRQNFAQAEEMLLSATTISLQKPAPISLIKSRKVG